MLWDGGWTKLGWPAECGGFGANPRLRALIYEEITTAGYLLPEGMTGIEVMVNPLIQFAPELAAQFAAPYLRGDELWCQGFSEPDAGSDLAAVCTRADIDGEVLRVSGQKLWSSFSEFSSRCLMLVRTGERASGHRGLTMILMDLDTNGVTVVPTRAATGRNEFGEIFLDQAEVPLRRVVGNIGQGWEIAMYLLQWERGMYAWQRQGFLHLRLERLLQSYNGAGLQTDTERIGAAYLDLNRLRFAARRTVELLSANTDPTAAISVDKILLARAEQHLFDLAHDLFATRLVLSDQEEDMVLRTEYMFSRAASIYGGSADIQRNIVAERVLGLPRS
jgi:hypothetical protein